jgi:hypothetical protein
VQKLRARLLRDLPAVEEVGGRTKPTHYIKEGNLKKKGIF